MPGFHDGSACHFCGSSHSAGAHLCRGCGATFSRRKVSVWALLLFLPLFAFVAVLGAAIRMDLPPRDLLIAFPLAWLALGLAYFAWTRRATWRRGETLVLRDSSESAHRARVTPIFMQWSTAATTAAVVGVLWIVSAGQPLDPANAALVLPLDSGSLGSSPVNSGHVSNGAGMRAEASTPATAVALIAPLPLEKPIRVAAMEEPAEKLALAITPVAVRQDEPEAPALAPVAAAVPDSAEAEGEQAIVLTAQKMLDGLGYSVGKVDGKPGTKTRVAVQSFREREGLSRGETIDAGLVAALEKATARRQAAIQRARQQQAALSPAPQIAASLAPTPVVSAATPPAVSSRRPQVSDDASAPLRLRGPMVQSARAEVAPESVGF